MAFPRKLRDLCMPALIYFILASLMLIYFIYDNFGNQNHLKVGSKVMSVPNTTLIFVLKLIYILFWTWVLNLICKDGYSIISWILVLLPFIVMFLMFSMVIM